MSGRCTYFPSKAHQGDNKGYFLKDLYRTGKESGRNNKIWNLESKQTDRNFLVGLKMFNPKLEVRKMEKNFQAHILAASCAFVKEG